MKKTTEQFIKEAKLIHKNKYDYSLVNYKSNKTNVKIICPIHGVFKQAPYHHLQGNGCPLCKSSLNERKIEKILNDYNIDFKREFRFDSCRDRRTLPFDFYLPKFNVCIEYDGQQHFRPTDFKNYNHISEEAKNSFEIIKKHDRIKTDFCNSNNIKLVRISYKDNIVEKLNFLLE